MPRCLALAAHLSDSQVAEPANQLLLVQLVSSHFHPPHLDHLLVKLNQVVLGRLDLEGGHVVLVDVERLLGQLDLEGLRRARGGGGRGRGRVGRQVDEA